MIKAVDCSLIKVMYMNSLDMSTEWIFNGSLCIKIVQEKINRIMRSRPPPISIIPGVNNLQLPFVPQNMFSNRHLASNNNSYNNGYFNVPDFSSRRWQFGNGISMAISDYSRPRSDRFGVSSNDISQVQNNNPVGFQNVTTDSFSNSTDQHNGNLGRRLLDDSLDQFLLFKGGQESEYTHVVSTLTPDAASERTYSVCSTVFTKSKQKSADDNSECRTLVELASGTECKTLIEVTSGTEASDLNNNQLTLVQARALVYNSPLPFEENSFEKHLVCSPNCVSKFDKIFSNTSESLLLVPIRNGFQRIILCEAEFFVEEVLKFDPYACWESEKVTYKTPCGLMLRNPEEIGMYLSQTEMKLPIDCFSFEPELYDLFESTDLLKCTVVSDDVSDGVETLPIRAVNDIEKRSSCTVPIFDKYILENLWSADVG